VANWAQWVVAAEERAADIISDVDTAQDIEIRNVPKETKITYDDELTDKQMRAISNTQR
jgi:predicted DNA binding protein